MNNARRIRSGTRVDNDDKASCFGETRNCVSRRAATRYLTQLAKEEKKKETETRKSEGRRVRSYGDLCLVCPSSVERLADRRYRKGVSGRLRGWTTELFPMVGQGSDAGARKHQTTAVSPVRGLRRNIHSAGRFAAMVHVQPRRYILDACRVANGA